MNSEQQQQRIMGYFIEEAKDHLNTIEQGVLNLQDVLLDTEMINEVFRAAHSIKGGAAMLGVVSVQHISHRLEDYFKILQEHANIQVDERLKSLLLASFDRLQELIEYLEVNYKISDELATSATNNVKPVFAELEAHLHKLVDGLGSEDLYFEPETIAPDTISSIFQGDVANKLRDMLELFKQSEEFQTRQQLQDICNDLYAFGQRFDLINWCKLTTTTRAAIAFADNSYRILAPIIIKDLKQAQDLVLAQRDNQIAVSPQLQSLIPAPLASFDDDSDITVFMDATFVQSSSDDDTSIEDLFSDAGIDIETATTEFDQFEDFLLATEVAPEVEASDLSNQSSLFADDQVDLDLAWEAIESTQTVISDQGGEAATSTDNDDFGDFFTSSESGGSFDALFESSFDSSEPSFDELNLGEISSEVQGSASSDFAFFETEEPVLVELETVVADSLDLQTEEDDLGLDDFFSANEEPASIDLESIDAGLWDGGNEEMEFNEEIEFGDSLNEFTLSAENIEQTDPSDPLVFSIEPTDQSDQLNAVESENLDLENFFDTINVSESMSEDSMEFNDEIEFGDSLNEFAPSAENIEKTDPSDPLVSSIEPTDQSDQLNAVESENLDLENFFDTINVSESMSEDSEDMAVIPTTLEEFSMVTEIDDWEDLGTAIADPDDVELADFFMGSNQEQSVIDLSEDALDDLVEEDFEQVDSDDQLFSEAFDGSINFESDNLDGFDSLVASDSGSNQTFDSIDFDSIDFNDLSGSDEVVDQVTDQANVAMGGVELTETERSTEDSVENLIDFFGGNQTPSLTQELDEFDQLEAMIDTPSQSLIPVNFNVVAPASNFDDLEALLENPPLVKKAMSDDFGDLEELLRDANDAAPKPSTSTNKRPAAKRQSSKIVSQTMKVDVKHLDSLNNLVGELVVNRNLLDEDQDKLQQFLGNLLNQVQQLSEVSQKMRDQYDRSLLESSLLATREQSKVSTSLSLIERSNDGESVGGDFDSIELDRFSDFHALSQEIIELIVRVRESASDIEFVVGETEQVTRQLGVITTQVQDDLKSSRMVPFAQIADRLPRAVRDLAIRTGKQADIEINGRETLIDKAILEQLYDPMTHLVSNAIVHGLEDPETRRRAGKPPGGKITVRAYHQGNQTVISVGDDGAGIDTNRVKQSAVSKGIRTQAEVNQLADDEVYELLFEAGFSTKSQADEFSGRGVGLDVVSTALNDIRGTMYTESAMGKGTTFTTRLPLTLSISKAMFCVSDRTQIAFPVDGFEDMVEVPQSQVQTGTKGETSIQWRDTTLPFQPLSNLLFYNRQANRTNIYNKQDDDVISIIILRNESNYLALQVDQFLGENEIVIKQLEGPIPKPAGIAGATVLGDGRVMSIANVLELFDIASGRLRPAQSGTPVDELPELDETEPTVLIIDDSIMVRELLKLTFAKVGYRVEQARDGKDAWEKLRAGLRCNLIFCDIEMPRMDGLEFLSRLRKDEFLSKIPVAMLTSRGADRHRQTAKELGASGYFTKPYLEEELLTASKRLLKGEILV